MATQKMASDPTHAPERKEDKEIPYAAEIEWWERQLCCGILEAHFILNKRCRLSTLVVLILCLGHNTAEILSNSLLWTITSAFLVIGIVDSRFSQQCMLIARPPISLVYLLFWLLSNAYVHTVVVLGGRPLVVIASIWIIQWGATNSLETLQAFGLARSSYEVDTVKAKEEAIKLTWRWIVWREAVGRWNASMVSALVLTSLSMVFDDVVYTTGVAIVCTYFTLNRCKRWRLLPPDTLNSDLRFGASIFGIWFVVLSSIAAVFSSTSSFLAGWIWLLSVDKTCVKTVLTRNTNPSGATFWINRTSLREGVTQVITVGRIVIQYLSDLYGRTAVWQEFWNAVLYQGSPNSLLMKEKHSISLTETIETTVAAELVFVISPQDIHYTLTALDVVGGEQVFRVSLPAPEGATHNASWLYDTSLHTLYEYNRGSRTFYIRKLDELSVRPLISPIPHTIQYDLENLYMGKGYIIGAVRLAEGKRDNASLLLEIGEDGLFGREIYITWPFEYPTGLGFWI